MSKFELGKSKTVLDGGDFHLNILIPALVVAGTICQNVQGTNLIARTNKDSWKLKERPRSWPPDQICHNGRTLSTLDRPPTTVSWLSVKHSEGPKC